jgi:hypothetical protein
MEQYIILADKYNKKFGSQITMLQLTPLIKTNKALHPIYKKNMEWTA